jgi:predicted RNase H-like HicB family nuclease
MKMAYPVIINEEGNGYLVDIPGFNINTFGSSVYEAVEMARDAIGLAGIDKQDHKESLPTPLSIAEIKEISCTALISFIDVDFSDYRKELDNQTVKKNCTIPYRLSQKAEEAGINFSEVLRDGLQEKLKMT